MRNRKLLVFLTLGLASVSLAQQPATPPSAASQPTPTPTPAPGAVTPTPTPDDVRFIRYRISAGCVTMGSIVPPCIAEA